MKMKFLKHIYLVVLVLFLSTTGCESVLDETIISGVTAEYLNTPEGFIAGVNASYKPLRDYYGDEDGCEISIFGTDEFTNGGHGGAHDVNQYRAGLNAESNTFWDPWNKFYQAINACNAVITRGPEVDLPQEEKDAMIAEVRFLRAHYYFLLVRYFGPVTLTLEETTGVETEATRTPENEVYSAIIEDLNYAISMLPESQSEFGRATKWAAQHMLSMVYLTRAYTSFAESDDFNQAATLAIDIINSSDRALLDDFLNVFNMADANGNLSHTNEQNSEVIFSVQYSEDPLTNGEGNRNHLYFRPWYEVYNNGLDRALGHGYGRPWIRFRPTQWAMDNFRPLNVDSRFEKTFQTVWLYNTDRDIPEGAQVGDTAIWINTNDLTQQEVDAITNRLPGVALFGLHSNDIDEPWSWSLPDNINIFPSPVKVDDNLRPSLNYTNGSRDHIVYRLAETYLIAAEALLGRDGDGSAAVPYINAVRRRAAYEGMEAAMEVTASDITLDFILDERSRELYAEQKRWLDLTRTGKLLDRVKAFNPDAAPNIQEFHTLRPIPANQLIRTSNDYGQNPGY